jgi:hypothetical protein
MTKDLILLIPTPSEDLNSTELYKISTSFKHIPLEIQNQLFTTCQHPKPLNLLPVSTLSKTQYEDIPCSYPLRSAFCTCGLIHARHSIRIYYIEYQCRGRSAVMSGVATRILTASRGRIKSRYQGDK